MTQHEITCIRAPDGTAVTCRLSRSLFEALEQHRRQTGESLDHVIRSALADYLQLEHGTLYQVSTAGALVEGLSRGEVTVGALKQHGDFGIGTFDGLDSDLVAVDGQFFEVAADGSVCAASDTATTPYAMVTRFAPEVRRTLEACADLAALYEQLDRLRRSDNHFYAVQVDGRFTRVRIRPVRRREQGMRPARAAAYEPVLALGDIAGTLVGFWVPAYAQRIAVPGYHLHVLSRDRTTGGHLLDCGGEQLVAAVQHEADLRVSLPETPSFLRANLSGDPGAAQQAEQTQRNGG